MLTKWFPISAILTAIFSQSGCTAGAISSSDLQPLPVQQPYLLGPGDQISISLYGDEDFSGNYRISPSGNVSLPLIGSLQAEGKTIDDIGNLITARLADGYYVDPRLSAEIIAFRPFYILGEVNRPGEYPYSSDLTLSKAVAIAGGYTYRANEKTISLQRSNADTARRVKIDQIIRIAPGDTIKILERFF